MPDLDGLELLDREDLIAMVKRMVNGGVSLSFHGKRSAMEIVRKVRPRVTRRVKISMWEVQRIKVKTC